MALERESCPECGSNNVRLMDPSRDVWVCLDCHWVFEEDFRDLPGKDVGPHDWRDPDPPERYKCNGYY